MKPITVGLDIGGTRLKGGVIDARGRVIFRDVEPTRPGQSLRAFEKQLDALIGRLVEAGGGQLTGVGAAITGPVDPEVGCVFLPGKIRGLHKHPTVPYLRKRWGVPVTADNDGRLAAYAEWRAGAGRGVDNLVVLTLGTGIGSGVVLDGRLLSDRHFQRGTQCGHFVIESGGPLCLTGAQGTGESLASVTALVHDVRSALARGLPLKFPPGKAGHEIQFTDVVAALRGGDSLLKEIFERWLDRFSAVLLNAFYAYTPDVIVLAGGPVKAAPLFIRQLEARLNRMAFRFPVAYKIPIRPARLGEDAGWIGAALRVQELYPHS